MFTSEERRFIVRRDVCRLATIAEEGWPHVVPVGYVFVDGRFVIPANRDTKKVANVRAHDRVCIVIDDEVLRRGKRVEVGVMIQCRAKIVGNRERERRKQYLTRKKGWEESEATLIIEAVPVEKASWGLGNRDLS